MPLPPDFDRELWLDPLAFQGLVGRALAADVYSRLFRPDGFAKPIAELSQDPDVAKLLPGYKPPRRAKMTRFPQTSAAWRRLKRAIADCIVAYVDPEAATSKRRLATYEGVAARWGSITLRRDGDGGSAF